MDEEQIELKIASNRPALSDDSEKRKLDLDLKLKEEQYENTYQTCCSRSGKTDKRLIQYGTAGVCKSAPLLHKSYINGSRRMVKTRGGKSNVDFHK